MEELSPVINTTSGELVFVSTKKLKTFKGKNEKKTKDEEDTNIYPFLKDITNYSNRILEEEVEDENKKKYFGYKKKEEVARERWKLLAKALLKPRRSTKIKDISVRRFSTFQLFTSNKIDKINNYGFWLKYSTKINNTVYLVEIHHLEQKITAKELMGFNNTGNICIWPSEEVLAYYVLSNINLFENKEILELGGGMTCLAGVLLAKFGKNMRVDLTDGNTISIENVQQILQKNQLYKDVASAFQLDWKNHRHVKTYDIVLSSDCLFFDETRADLVNTIWDCMKNDGIALVMAPKRGNTLNSFVKLAARKGFYYIIYNYYNDTVWKQHLKFKKFNQEYDENLHYPIFLLLTKSSQVLKNSGFTG